MTEPTSKQQILIPYDFSKAAENALLYGIELARLFKCEISIFYIVTKIIAKLEVKDIEVTEARKKALGEIANRIISQEGIMANVYVFKGEVQQVIHDFYEKLNAIAVMAGMNSFKSKVHCFSSSSLVTDYRDLRIPIIIVHDELPRKRMYENIILPLDFNRESKEKSAWSGYISTLNQSRVTVLTRKYKDAYFAASLRTNIVLVEKLFNNLGVAYELIKEPDITCDIDKYAVDYAWINQGDMIVIMATKEVAVDDLLFGLKEKKIIENKYKLPIMLINPRDDLYLPCGC